MADISKSLKLLAKLEYSNMPSKFLHKNKNESTFTCGGVYKKANPNALDWEFIENLYLLCDKDIKRTSIILYADNQIHKDIQAFAKKEIWDKMRLDKVISQKMADEMFCFAFHTHWKTAARIAQNLIGTKSDGYIGPISLKALNSFDSDKFDMVFDEKEKEHYEKIIKNKPYLQLNYKGWLNRAYSI